MSKGNGKPKQAKRARISDAITNAPAQQRGEGAETLREIAQRTGMCAERIRTLLYQYRAEGRLRTAKEIRENLAGGHQPTPVYWIE